MVRQTLIRALLVLTTFMLCVAKTVAQEKPTEHQWDNVIKAISVVESGEKPNARNGQYVGILQIGNAAVKDCNRINIKNDDPRRYTLKDRYDREKSIEMFWIIQKFYNPELDIEKAIRLWNGGVGNLKHPHKTERYYKKVMSVLKKIEETSE